MNELQDSLLAEHYQVLAIDYPSTEKPIDALTSWVFQQVRDSIQTYHCSTTHFVTHSMGGILVRDFLADDTLSTLGRVVMLGPPNQGSEVVDNLRNWSLFQFINGPAGSELGTDSLSLPKRLGPVNFELGVIAGDRSINWINSLMIPSKDDGKVSIESTRVEGMKDHIVLHTTHPLMMTNKHVIHQVLVFLKQGVFEHKEPSN